ncbi:hypothetical protein SBY92_004537 [Candida maltosa Xu316]
MEDDNQHDIDQFFSAIMHWLSEFPKSPITPEITVQQFLKPTNIFNLFKLLLFRDDLEDETCFNDNSDIDVDESSFHIHKNTMKQIEALDHILDHHLRSRSDLNSFPYLNMYKLIIVQDLSELRTFCQILYKIGTFTSRLSTNGLSYFEFLTDSDKNIINHCKESKKRKNKYPGLREKSSPPVETNSDYEGFSDSTNDAYYCIPEEELDAIQWENSIFENLIYKLAKEMKS